MTSKEAFESLIKNYKHLKKFKEWDGVEFDKILKDLENYEFLKDIMRRVIVLKDSKQLLEQNKERLKEILLDEEGRTN